jgi:3-oxoacyl-[acyl-carrier protein] reductase
VRSTGSLIIGAPGGIVTEGLPPNVSCRSEPGAIATPSPASATCALPMIPLAEWRRTLDVNLTAVFLCAKAVVPAMTAQGFGRIVNVSSTAGKSVSTLGGAHYTASKAGVLGLTRAAAKELAPLGITVNAVCPGLIDTEMVRQNVAADRLEAYRRSFPIPRLGTAEEVADLIAFLASDQAGYVTGASFDITGGDLMV